MAVHNLYLSTYDYVMKGNDEEQSLKNHLFQTASFQSAPHLCGYLSATTNTGDKEPTLMTHRPSKRPLSPNLFDIPIHANQHELSPD